MPSLITSNFNLPNNIAEGIFKKAQSGSTLARLCGSTPQKFGTSQAWVLTAPPKAELVGEAAKKSETPATYAPKTINPLKVQVTMRFTNEVMWADEDTQIGVLQDLSDNAAIALGRALDLMAIHKINPLTGAVSDLVNSGLVDVTGESLLADGAYDAAVEAAAGAVIANGYTPTGVAMDPALSFGIATMRDKEGRKLYPNMDFGQNLTSFMGMNAAVSDTVSAKNEIAIASNLLGIVGQFDAIRWGVQRQIGVKLIEFGDPDGLGDLQRQNQIALRAEIVYGVGVLAEDAFVKIKKKA